MSYFWPPAEDFHFNVYNIHTYYHKTFFKKAVLTVLQLVISDELFFFLSERQEDALVLAHEQ